MKKAFLILALMAVCGSAFAKTYYVYFSRTDGFANGVKGELIDIVPIKKINPPPQDYQNFCLIKMELTDEEYKKMIAEKEKTIINETVKSDSENVKQIKDVSFNSIAASVIK